MFLAELKSDLKTIKGAGPQSLRLLSRLGITDIKTLLCHYPRDWEDRTRAVSLCDWNKAKVCTEVRVLSHEWFGAGYMKTLKINVEDDTARASLICFNRPFLAKQFPIGLKVRILGHFYHKYGEVQSSSFEIVDAKDGSFGRILPIYPLCEGLSQAQLRRFTSQALALYASGLEDELPDFITKSEELLSKADAIRAIHFPASFNEKDRARRTLVFEELFYLEMMTVSRILERKKIQADMDSSGKKISGQGAASAHVPGDFSPLQKRLIERLPFSLTSGQTETAREINLDMDGPYPMARLLQGDVGSGKTLVAFLACLKAVEGGDENSQGQAALMAPTELLARQHAETAAKLLEPLGLRIAFLTGNLKAGGRTRLLAALAAGEIDIVAGTHALFSRDTIYKNLKLVIVDEQHRFGVTQRQAIMAKGDYPNLLMMSATPIPRTLALTVFGDLDVSVISDMPPGRKPVKTHLSKTSNAKKVYDFVRKELAKGHQAYFVYPIIETSAPLQQDLKDAQTMAKKLSGQVFPQYPVALIHSRLDDEEKQGTMEDFRKGKIKVLAATSVVEVGVDVANATCMVVEHAERFGLAALHQLRGRVGRGEEQSYCFLIYSDQEVPEEYAGMNPGLLSDEERSKEGRRLMVMLENNDGFEIAEKDLLFRGPGQIAGFQQSGYLKLGIADPLRDTEELERARKYAFTVLESDPGLEKQEHLCIKEMMNRTPLFGEVVF